MADAMKVWTAEELINYAKTTKDVEICGGIFRIKKLPASIIESAKNDDYFYAIQSGLVEPALTKEQLKNLPADMVTQLTKAITSFSGLDAEQAEKN